MVCERGICLRDPHPRHVAGNAIALGDGASMSFPGMAIVASEASSVIVAYGRVKGLVRVMAGSASGAGIILSVASASLQTVSLKPHCADSPNGELIHLLPGAVAGSAEIRHLTGR